MAIDITSYLLGKKGSGGASGLKVEVVQELPTTGEDNVLYLVPKTTTGTNNVFEEYLWIDNDWELIGTTDIDLSDYQTIANLVTSIDAQSTDSQYPSAKLLYDIISGLSGGGGVFEYTTEGTSSNPFVFEGKKKGVYVVKNASTASYPKFYYKKLSSSSSQYLNNFQYLMVIMLENYDGTQTSNIGIIIGKDVTSWALTSQSISFPTSSSIATFESQVGIVGINGSLQNWGGIKVFSSVPRYYSDNMTPSDNKDLTSKKYVDDKPTTYSGYDATKTQILKNINGTLTWVDE